MVPQKGRKRILIGSALGIVGLFALLSFTGPTADREISGAVQRMGGPCLTLERWGLFGWAELGQTATLPQTTRGVWDDADDQVPCVDISDSTILVRMPIGAEPGIYRICGTADDFPCLTVKVVPFRPDSPGP